MQLIQEYLRDESVRKELKDKDCRNLGFLAALGLAREPPFDGWNLPIEGFRWFHIMQLYRAARKVDPLGDLHHPLGLPRFERARRYLTALTKQPSTDAWVKVLPRQEKVGQPFAVTDNGYNFILDRLDKILDYLDRRKEVKVTMKSASHAYTTENVNMVVPDQLPTLTTIRLVTEQALTIGRLEENEYAFVKDRAMSRRHARVTFRNERFWIDDLQSTNGTWKIDQNQSSGRRRVQYEEIKDSDKFQLGNTLIRFLCTRPSQ